MKATSQEPKIVIIYIMIYNNIIETNISGLWKKCLLIFKNIYILSLQLKIVSFLAEYCYSRCLKALLVYFKVSQHLDLDLPWFTLIYLDLPWFTLIYLDLPWFTLIYLTTISFVLLSSTIQFKSKNHLFLTVVLMK